jgi:hypothetical protein
MFCCTLSNGPGELAELPNDRISPSLEMFVDGGSSGLDGCHDDSAKFPVFRDNRGYSFR